MRLDSMGYLRASPHNQHVHRLVWETYYGAIPKGYHVHHINGEKTDNRIENLSLLKSDDHRRFHSKRYINVDGVWLKQCKKCMRELSLDCFRKVSTSGELVSVCRECEPIVHFERYHANPDRHRGYAKKYRENNPATLKERWKAYYEKNKEKLREVSREYQRRKREKQV